MLGKLWENLHQSYFVVFWCVGMIAGVVMALIFKINYFASPWWCVLSTLLFLVTYLKPKYVFVVVAFISGVLVAFFRMSGEIGTVQTGLEGLVTEGRDWFAARIQNLIPEPEASLGLSYLLGMKAGLSEELSENLRTVGLVHIVVASGAHLGILVEIARKIFGKISRFAGLLFSILFILLFMMMVGWTPSIMRAGIMAILNLLAWYVGRKIAPWRIILIVAAATLMINPTYVTNLGWLLSFASFGGIMILGPQMMKFFYGKKKPGPISSTIITTISATIMTLPLTLYYFGQISLISVVANLLILPTLSWAMGLTFLTGVFAGISGIENVVSFLTMKLLDFHIFVVELFGQMTPFLIKISPYRPQIFLLYLVVLVLIVGFILISRYRQKMQKMIK